MKRYVLTAHAEKDLEDLAGFIALDSPGAARRVLDDFHVAMTRLAEMPHIGHRRDDLGEEALRVWLVHTDLIVYRPETNPLQVLRIIVDFAEILPSRFGDDTRQGNSCEPRRRFGHDGARQEYELLHMGITDTPAAGVRGLARNGSASLGRRK